MSLQLLIEWFVAIMLIVGGLSHMLHPRLWAQFFIDLFAKPYAGFIVGAITLPLGLFVALGHNVWVLRPPVIVTLIGWAWTIKSTIYLLHPRVLQKVGRRHMEHPQRFIAIGIVMIVLGSVIIGYRIYFAASAPWSSEP